MVRLKFAVRLGLALCLSGHIENVIAGMSLRILEYRTSLIIPSLFQRGGFDNHRGDPGIEPSSIVPNVHRRSTTHQYYQDHQHDWS